ncbi:hypothetical protein HYW75_00795 [Candidatus Pacearchaeota archaeon]|nr:hypothetical protein [Candidatus Pacearchaeota archaeon]
MNLENIKTLLRRFWFFLKEDSWQSLLVSIILIILIIKFIFFPLLSFITGSPLPLVVIESCSMYHPSQFEDWWSQNSLLYENKNITKPEFIKFPFRNGLNKGDIVFVWGRADYKLGDVITFIPNPESTSKYPIIHRIVSLSPRGSKGDNNIIQLMKNNNPQQTDETSIPENNVMGKAALRIPFVGWIKLIFFEPFKDSKFRGFCK